MCNRDCDCVLGVIISLFLGVIIGVLFYFSLIPTITTALWIAFGLAALALVLIVGISIFGTPKCVCGNGKCLLAGIIGTLVTATISLSLTLTATSVIYAIIVGLTGFFFSLLLISFIYLISCLIEAHCNTRG